MLQQSNIHPHLSVWSHYNGVFDYNATPMGPLGCKVLIHEPVQTRSSLSFHCIPGYYCGPALHHYRSVTVFPNKTRTPRISDTAEFQYHYIIVPIVTSEDKVVDTISKLKTELAGIPTPNSTPQLAAIKNLQEIFSRYKSF